MLENNRMVQASYEGNKPSLASIIMMPFLFTLTLSIGNVISELIGSLLFNNLEESLFRIYMQYFQYAVSFALAGAIVVLFMCKVQGKNWRSIGLFKEKAVVSYFKGAGIAFLGIVAIISFLQFKGELTISAIPINRGVHLFGIILIILIAWIIQGAAEELFLRGFMFQAITVRYDVYKGIIIPAIVFALLHLGNNGINAISLINILLCGLALMLLVLKDGNLWGAFGFHTAWNLLQGNVFGISISGNTMDVSLFKTVIQTDTIWSGGAFGLEGSLLTTLFFILASLVLVRQLSKHNR